MIKHLNRGIRAIALLTLLLASGACSSSQEPSLQRAIESRAHDTALRMIADTDLTLDQINAGQPPFISGSNPASYVYIYDLDLNVVAHPDYSERGASHANRMDANRTPYPQQILSRVLGRKKGQEGWIEYTEGGLHRLAYYELAQGRNGYYYIIVSTTPIGSVQGRSQAPREIRPPQELGNY